MAGKYMPRRGPATFVVFRMDRRAGRPRKELSVLSMLSARCSMPLC